MLRDLLVDDQQVSNVSGRTLVERNTRPPTLESQYKQESLSRSWSLGLPWLVIFRISHRVHADVDLRTWSCNRTGSDDGLHTWPSLSQCMIINCSHTLVVKSKCRSYLLYPFVRSQAISSYQSQPPLTFLVYSIFWQGDLLGARHRTSYSRATYNDYCHHKREGRRCCPCRTGTDSRQPIRCCGSFCA